MDNTLTPQILVTPLKPALIQGLAQKLPVLIRVQAPDRPASAAAPRKPYRLSLVIDRSGSMSGEPLAEAVRCARHMVDRLMPTDVAAIVAFDDRVKVLAAAQPVGDRTALHRALARIHAGGSTNLHGGWQAGADALLPEATSAALARVILLSDGNANVGVENTAEIAAFCRQAAAQGVSTSTYGLGRSFNEALMVEMARAGNGNPYYGNTANDLFEPFAEEFDFIANLYGRNLRLALSAPDGVKIRLLNDYPVEAQGGFPLIRLPDVPYGAEAWALVELEVPAELALESGNPLLQAGVTGTTADGEPIAFADVRLTLPAVSPPAWDTLLPDETVAARRMELEAAQFISEARAAAERGDWRKVEAMIAEGRTRFADHPWVLAILGSLGDLAHEMDQARFAKEAMYSSRKMSARVVGKEEMAASLASEDAMPSYLRRKRAQGKASFPQGSDKAC